MQVAVNLQIKYISKCEVITEDFFVDGIITGSDSLQQLDLMKIVNILKATGFHLRKFQSNSSNDLFIFQFPKFGTTRVEFTQRTMGRICSHGFIHETVKI